MLQGLYRFWSGIQHHDAHMVKACEQAHVFDAVAATMKGFDQNGQQKNWQVDLELLEYFCVIHAEPNR